MNTPLVFDAVVAKVSTLSDGGIRVTFDLPETAIEAAAELMRCKREEVPLRVACARMNDGPAEDSD
jgi:hypothetical protein